MLPSLFNSPVMRQVFLLKKLKLYPFFRAIEDTCAAKVVVAGQEQIMIGSNNYLGLTHHPYVMEKAKEAIDKYGTGCTGSRFLNGNLDIHEDLEEKLAKYLGHEKVIVFSTGMQSNLGAISALCKEGDCIFSDEENHASIIDAIKLSRAKAIVFKHNDMQSLEEKLKESRKEYKRAVIVADGVFSMSGDIINLPEIVSLAKKYKALVYVDDAHGLGVMGDRGRGTMNHFNLTDKVHVNMGTFSKSFASIGGFISGDRATVEHIQHTARAFIFSASMPPAAVATVSACLDIVMQDNSIFENLWRNVAFMQKGFKEIGLYTYNSQTPIIPVFIGDDMKVMQITKFLGKHGLFATPVISPAVPQGEALIRTSYMACHELADLQRVLDVFALAKKEYNIPSAHQ